MPRYIRTKLYLLQQLHDADENNITTLNTTAANADKKYKLEIACT